MKKSTIHYIMDKGMYLCLILLPLVILAVVAINGGVPAVHQVMADYTGYFEGVDLYNDIISVIGEDGVAPLLNANTAWLADFAVYVIYITLIHLLIDCVGFIPAAAHAFMVKIGGDYYA